MLGKLGEALSGEVGFKLRLKGWVGKGEEESMEEVARKHDIRGRREGRCAEVMLKQ